jgi:RNA polymerase sigma-70 factor (ECF subfamily)
MQTSPGDSLHADRDLVREVQAGRPEAQAALMERLYRRVHRLSGWLARHDAEAEDFAQEALIAILESAHRYRGEGSLEAWADAVAVRVIRRKLGRTRRFHWLLGGEWREPEASRATPEQELQSRARADRLTALLSGLAPNERLVLVLKLAYGYSAKEVSDLTGLSLKAVQYQLKRGRAELRRRALRDEELTASTPGVAP